MTDDRCPLARLCGGAYAIKEILDTCDRAQIDRTLQDSGICGVHMRVDKSRSHKMAVKWDYLIRDIAVRRSRSVISEPRDGVPINQNGRCEG
jgi:hypothetical protein